MLKTKTENYASEAEYSLKDTDDKILLNLRDLGMALSMLYDGKLSQRRALIMLYNSGGMSQRELTEKLSIRPASMSEVLAKLSKKGLISKKPFPGDSRTSFVSLTEEGLSKAVHSIELRTEMREELLAPLSAEEREELLTLLEKINIA